MGRKCREASEASAVARGERRLAETKAIVRRKTWIKGHLGGEIRLGHG